MLHSLLETPSARSIEMVVCSFPAPHSQQHLLLVWRTPQTQCSKVLLCSLKVTFHCYFRLCFVLVKLFCFGLEIQTGNFCLSNDSVAKVKHGVTMFPHLPTDRHGEVLCLCIPQRGIFSFSLLLILSLFAVVLPWCAETGHCARETTVLCSIRQPIGRSANLSPTPEPWCFSKVSGQCELPISTCLVPRRGEVAGVGGCRHT